MDIISNLKTGDIILFHTKFNILNPYTWVSVPIRYALNTHYSHVGVIIQNWDINFVNESTRKGITAHLAAHKLRGKKYKVLRSKEGIEEATFARTANNLLGVSKYNYFVLLIAMFVYRFFGKWIVSDSKSVATDKLICSTYVAYCFNLPYWFMATPVTFERNDKFETIYKS